MIVATLAWVAEATSGLMAGEPVSFEGVSTDTRTLLPGQLFVALRGPNFDAHDLVAAAAEAGAVGLVVERDVETRLPTVKVADTRRALADMASAHRDRFALPVVGVTGSNGKTTTRALVSMLFDELGPVMATEGNLNNDIGVPLTLFRLSKTHRSAVVEMGANHAGEIAALTRISRPTIALVTNAGNAHLEGFGDIDGVARAKGELYAESGPETVAVINADDPRVPIWRELAADRPRIEFGIDDPDAVISADEIELEAGGSRFRLRICDETHQVRLPLPGRHNIMNALAACAAAHAADIAGVDIAARLSMARSVAGRSRLLRHRDGGHLIDDCYNANPDSLRAGIDVLVGLGARPWLVMGDMRELGEDEVDQHRRMGRYAREAGVRRLLSLGALAAEAADSFGEGGDAFDEVEDLIGALGELGPGVNVLVKGSRAMRLERVVDALAASEEG